MTETIVIPVRVVLGIAVAIVGLFALSQGLVMVAHEDFSLFGWLGAAMIADLAIGSALVCASWRLLATTLKMPEK